MGQSTDGSSTAPIKSHLIILVVESSGPLLCKTDHSSPVAIVKGRLQLEVDAVLEIGYLLSIHECQTSRRFSRPN